MQRERLPRIADKYERLVNSGGIRWIPVDQSSLHPHTVRYINAFLDPSKLKYLIADLRVEKTVLFKIEHDYIKFLHHDPITVQHMWVGDGFHEFLPNDAVLDILHKLAIPFS